MKRLLILMSTAAIFLFCSPEELQETISGCEIEEGIIDCRNLKIDCKLGYSEREDPEAQDGIKCQCCEDGE